MKKLLEKANLALKTLVCLTLIVIILTGGMSVSAATPTKKLTPLGSVITTFYTEPNDTADVVFIGSSAVYRFFSPAQLYSKYGITSLNYSAISLHPRAIPGLIKEVSDHQHPKVIVVEMRRFIKHCDQYAKGTPFTIQQKTHQEEMFLDLVRNMPASANRSKVIKDTVKSWGYNAVKWEMKKFYPEYKLKKYTVKQMQNILKKNYKPVKSPYTFTENSTYVGGKYKGTIGMSKIKSVKITDYSNNTEIKEITGEWRGVLDKIIESAKTCGSEVLFVSTPHATTKTNIAYENALGEILKENGLNYLDCNKLYKEIGLSFTCDYYDKNHTNVKGMVKVTNYVGKYLITNYGLEKTFLTKGQKKSWDNASKLWIKEVRTPMNKKVNSYLKNKS